MERSNFFVCVKLEVIEAFYQVWLPSRILPYTFSCFGPYVCCLKAPFDKVVFAVLNFMFCRTLP